MIATYKSVNGRYVANFKGTDYEFFLNNMKAHRSINKSGQQTKVKAQKFNAC